MNHFFYWIINIEIIHKDIERPRQNDESILQSVNE
jgi:hypothetical protein